MALTLWLSLVVACLVISVTPGGRCGEHHDDLF